MLISEKHPSLFTDLILHFLKHFYMSTVRDDLYENATALHNKTVFPEETSEVYLRYFEFVYICINLYKFFVLSLLCASVNMLVVIYQNNSIELSLKPEE